MGCDAYADEKGRFTIAIYDYENSRFLGRISIHDLEPSHRISIEVEDGTER